LARLLALLESADLPDADVHELIHQSRAEVSQIRELIDDVLFLSELETGNEVVALGSTAACPILRDVVTELADRAEGAHVTMSGGCAGDVEVPLRPRMLRVVASNLAENAMRYAGEGARFVLAAYASDGEVVLSASDDGDGVGEHDLPRLFERFYRADH